MNVEKINNVVLYAKNWYRHSNGIFADLKKYVGLDHPDQLVAEMSLSELYKLMCSDYIQWAESVTEDDNIGTDINNLPDAIKDAQYYTYGDNKLEQKAKAYWDSIKKQ